MILLAGVIIWAVDAPTSPWAVLGVLATILVPALTALGFIAATRQKRIADRQQHDIDIMKTGFTFVEGALLRSDKERADLDAELVELRTRCTTEIAALRASLTAAQAEIDQLKAAFSTERRHHADRVKVLVRRIRELGGTEEDTL